jgi:hypothetical protein
VTFDDKLRRQIADDGYGDRPELAEYVFQLRRANRFMWLKNFLSFVIGGGCALFGAGWVIFHIAKFVWSRV